MRIAQITDLHARRALPGTATLEVRRSRETIDLLERALADAIERAADVVVLTGDIVDVPIELLDGRAEETPEREELLSAAEADYRLVRDRLEASALPYIALPGNHDSYASLGRVFGAGPYVRDIGPVRFVSFWDREGEGNVPQRSGADRRRFEEALRDPGSWPQVHLQHFVVTPQLNKGYPHTYPDGEDLRRRTVASGRVRLSLSGHYHRGTDLIHDGPAAFAVGSAFAERPHCYRIYEIPAEPKPVTMEQIETA